MLQLILVRHGETNSNRKGTYLGWTDVELNKEGLRQAESARNKLAGEKIDAIYSSPLMRAYKTAEIINQNHKMEIVCDDRLRERNFGIWDNLTNAEITQKYPREYEEYTKDWINFCVKDGESSIQAFERVTGFVDELAANNKDGSILIVTHLGCIRKIIAHLLGMTIEDSWRFKIDNAAISRVEINDEGYAYMTLMNG